MSTPEFRQFATYQNKDKFQGPPVFDIVIQG